MRREMSVVKYCLYAQYKHAYKYFIENKSRSINIQEIRDELRPAVVFYLHV